MIHTKTKPGTYDEKDYWIVAYTDIRSDNKSEWHRVEHKYRDVDNAYEDYCWYKNKWWARNCTYEHYRD